MDPKVVVPILQEATDHLKRLGAAITPNICGTGHFGGHVESLTEAVMDHTRGLAQIADAIRELAAAVRETRKD